MKKGTAPFAISLPVEEPMSCQMMLSVAHARENPFRFAFFSLFEILNSFQLTKYF